MIVFHTDIDSTLIYTERHDIGKDKVCVEYLRGNTFCYMTPTSVKLLNELKCKQNVEIVPLTARTEMEFKRVNLGDFKYALVTNGGILLRDDVVDQDWYQESLDIVSKSKESLDLCQHLLEIDPNRILDVKFVDNLYLYTKSANPQETVDLIKKRMDYSDLSINQFRSKVYVFLKGLNKDDSMERFKKVITRDKTFFADGALYNAPSNDSVDLFLTSDESVLQVANKQFMYVPKIFSDNLLRFVTEVVDNEIIS